MEKKGFNSNDKDKFVIGEEYYTFFMDLTNKRNRLRDYTGIMKVKVTSNEYKLIKEDCCEYYMGDTDFDIIESKKFGRTLSHNIYNYLNGYGTSTCDFFENYDDCVEAHDNQIKEFASNQIVSDREDMFRKLIKKNIPKKPKIEVESMNWYNGLSKKEKSYVSWLQDNL